MPHQLPPLNALRVFEVTARAGSYTEAARELHLTHGAISRQIRLLEEALGQPLFRKEGQRMVATGHAKAFAREISAAFDHISDAARRYGKKASSKVIRVNAPATLAMRWLIPQLPSFRAAHPDVEVRVSTAFSNDAVLRGSFDVGIRRIPEDKAQFEVLPLFSEYATVIASPAYLQQRKLRRPADLARATWLSTESRPGDWENWLAAAGAADLRAGQMLRFDHFFVTLQAVVDGMGIGIGPFPTLASDLELGRIVTPFPQLRSKGSDYFAVVPRDSDKPRFLRDFLGWLGSRAV
ncbi:MAG TPA: LysR substrate-binding domain-containing protein [Ramlibacter sp.]|jgi:DNA-binding transcriptional LysR family regulator|nr:LysR substrate-binding domain-containing protein [Ramlibacter sp.]